MADGRAAPGVSSAAADNASSSRYGRAQTTHSETWTTSRRVDTLGREAFRSNGTHPGEMGATQHAAETCTRNPAENIMLS